jgi:hypothetical protein
MRQVRSRSDQREFERVEVIQLQQDTEAVGGEGILA